MTSPTANYGWPKPDSSENASILGVNAALDAMDASMNTVATNMGAVIKPIVMVKWVDPMITIPSSTNVNLVGYQDWETVFYVEGTIPGTLGPNSDQPFGPTTYGYVRVSTEGIYRLTYNLNMLSYTGATEGYWFSKLVNSNTSASVPRTRNIIRMQTHISLGTSLYCTTLLKAASSGGDLLLDTNYNLIVFHYTGSTVNIGMTHSFMDPYFSYFSLEYVRGL